MRTRSTSHRKRLIRRENEILNNNLSNNIEEAKHDIIPEIDIMQRGVKRVFRDEDIPIAPPDIVEIPIEHKENVNTSHPFLPSLDFSQNWSEDYLKDIHKCVRGILLCHSRSIPFKRTQIHHFLSRRLNLIEVGTPQTTPLSSQNQQQRLENITSTSSISSLSTDPESNNPNPVAPVKKPIKNSSSRSSSSHIYILRSHYPSLSPELSIINQTSQELHLKGFLLIISSWIILSDGRLLEESLFKLLQEIGLKKLSLINSYTVDFILKLFQKQLYLHRSTSGDPPVSYYHLGPRWYLELSLQDCIAFLNETCDLDDQLEDIVSLFGSDLN